MSIPSVLRSLRRQLPPIAGLVAAFLVCPIAAHGPARPLAQGRGEVRALWVTRTTLRTPESVAAMVRAAAGTGFNTLLVQVRGRGDAYFNHRMEPRAATLARAPAFDPLDAVIALAHGAGLRVHAWFNVNLVASAVTLPDEHDHVVNEHPEWLMVPRPLAAELVAQSPRAAGYRNRIATWSRSQAASVEGLYLSPIPPDAARYTTRVAADLARRYAIDGLHLDYVRYPSDEFDYSRLALDEFRTDVGGGLTSAERRELDRRAGRDPLAYTTAFPEAWRAFRAARLTSLVAAIGATVRARRPSALVTAAVIPDGHVAESGRFQAWPGWLAAGLLDAACPMAYAPDAAGFDAQMTAALEAAGGRPLWAGIGAYRLSSAQVAENIRTARRFGAAGVVLFSYDSLIAPTGGADEYLAQVARAAFDQ